MKFTGYIPGSDLNGLKGFKGFGRGYYSDNELLIGRLVFGDMYACFKREEGEDAITEKTAKNFAKNIIEFKKKSYAVDEKETGALARKVHNALHYWSPDSTKRPCFGEPYGISLEKIKQDEYKHVINLNGRPLITVCNSDIADRLYNDILSYIEYNLKKLFD